MILSTLGLPSKEEMDFLADENARDYLASIECKKMKSLEEMFPQVPKAVIAILKKTIAFDPRKRATIDELLESEIFVDIRSKEM